MEEYYCSPVTAHLLGRMLLRMGGVRSHLEEQLLDYLGVQVSGHLVAEVMDPLVEVHSDIVEIGLAVNLGFQSS